MRKCSKCGKEKPLTDFYTYTCGSYYGQCKECWRGHRKKKYTENPQAQRDANKRWESKRKDKKDEGK